MRRYCHAFLSFRVRNYSIYSHFLTVMLIVVLEGLLLIIIITHQSDMHKTIAVLLGIKCVFYRLRESRLKQTPRDASDVKTLFLTMTTGARRRSYPIAVGCHRQLETASGNLCTATRFHLPAYALTAGHCLLTPTPKGKPDKALRCVLWREKEYGAMKSHGIEASRVEPSLGRRLESGWRWLIVPPAAGILVW